MDKYTILARKTIENYVTFGQTIDYSEHIEDFLGQKRGGVFVSLHLKSNHSLRGCIGTYQPTKDSLAEEIIDNSIAACSQDPRFLPVRKDELADLIINVDVLSKAVRINNRGELDPKKYGVIIRSRDGRTGLLLPDIEGVNTSEEQIRIACQKAGIENINDTEILKFTVERHK